MSIKQAKQEVLELKNDLQKYTIGTAAYFAVSSRIQLIENDIRNYEKSINKASITKK